jgi:hypothetical protein
MAADAGYEHVAEPLVRLCSRAVRRAEGIEQASELALAARGPLQVASVRGSIHLPM